MPEKGDTVVCVASYLRQIIDDPVKSERSDDSLAVRSQAFYKVVIILSHILAVSVITALRSLLYACPFRTEHTGPG